MKYTIEGFSQRYAMTLKKEVIVGKKTVLKKIDCTDLVILRWFVDFYPQMEKEIINGREYAWLKHSKLKEDLPLLDISKRAFIERMQKLVEFGILDYQLTRKKGKESGTFSFYTFGSNYVNLVRSSSTGVARSNVGGVVRSKNIPYDVQPYNKDTSTRDTSISNDIKDIVLFLNSVTGAKYRHANKETQKHIKARLNEGFTVEEFKEVIMKKYREWHGTTFEQYLRPSTLFGTKFEGYLNTPEINNSGKAEIQLTKEEQEEFYQIFGERA